MEDGRLGLHMSISATFFLAAVVGWGAFAYVALSSRQQERALREEMARVVAEREQLSSEMSRTRSESDRIRQVLEQVQADYAKARLKPEPQPTMLQGTPQIAPSAPVPASRARSNR